MIRCLTLMGSLLVGLAATAVGEDLKTEVRRLVTQLDAPQLAQREAAEDQLLDRGPAILEFLPAAGDRDSAEVRQRLSRVRQRLQQAAADASINASTITLHARDMRLSKILRAFQAQSGNAIIDCRPRFGQPASDPKLTVGFQKTPFWPALDQLLDQAGLTLYLYARQRAIGLAAAPSQKQAARVGHASYSGPFRFQPISIVARRDLREPDQGLLVLTLEVMWEPRLQIIGLMLPMADVRAVDRRGEPLPVADPAAKPESFSSSEFPSVKFDVPLRFPSRDAREIARLTGKLLATIAGKTETFRFDKLADAKNIERRIASVNVTLEQICPHPNPPLKGEGTGREVLPKKKGAGWEVRIRVRFDDAGDALASHRQWIFSNPAYLESSDGKLIAYDTFETTAQGKNELGLSFFFTTERSLDDLAFVYQTPGTIVTRPFEYELKGIKLPYDSPHDWRQ